jgi:hypothetical protein
MSSIQLYIGWDAGRYRTPYGRDEAWTLDAPHLRVSTVGQTTENQIREMEAAELGACHAVAAALSRPLCFVDVTAI